MLTRLLAALESYGVSGRERRTFHLFRTRLAHAVLVAGFACTEALVVLARLGEADPAIRAAAHHLRVVVVLAVVFPPAHRAHLETAAAVQRERTAARAAIGRHRLVLARDGDVGRIAEAELEENVIEQAAADADPD